MVHQAVDWVTSVRGAVRRGGIAPGVLGAMAFFFAGNTGGAEQRALSVDNNRAVEMRHGGQVLWRVNLDGPEGKPFFHPLTVPGTGTAFTALRPDDHKWHLGLWFSWKHLNGVNFWEPSEGASRVASCSVKTNADYAVDIALALSYATPDGALLVEDRRVRVETDPDGAYRILWDAQFASGSKPVAIERTKPGKNAEGIWVSGGYAGLNLRFAAAAVESLADPEGRQDAKVCGERGPWAAALVKGDAGGEQRAATVAVFDHPANPGYPNAWFARANPKGGYFVLGTAPVFHEPMTVPAGGRLRWQYAVEILPGKQSPGELNAAWKAFAARNTTYRNPIVDLPGAADPAAVLVDGVYYLYPTYRTREGYEVLASADLVHWERKGLCYRDRRGGAWAPDVFHHVHGDGQFYLYYTVDRPGGGKLIGVASAAGPLGPFEDRGTLKEGAIDAHLFRDDDGALYLYYADLSDGFRIKVQPMGDPVTPRGDAVELLRPTEPWERAQGHVTEGPWMLKRGGVYYLMYSGSGADGPHYGIGYATAGKPTGPFTKFAGNPIAARGNGIFGPGHHCVVPGPDGRSWMLYHQKADDGTNWRRFLALDPLWFDADGNLRTRVTRGTDERGP